MDELKKESNGFLDCVSVLGLCPAGMYGIFRVRGEKVYTYDLKKYKDAYNDLCDEYKRHATYEEFLKLLDEVMIVDGVNPKEKIAEYEKWVEENKKKQNLSIRKAELIKSYRAEFENACDDLYYGYGFSFWRTHNNRISDDEDARIVWRAAFEKMSR